MCFALILLGCSENYQKETWIERIVETGLSERDEVLLQDTILDYDVYRDGKNDGVCYEYIVELKQIGWRSTKSHSHTHC